MNEFLNHLNDPRPGFQCYAAGSKTAEIGFSTNVHHKINTKASAKELSRLDKLLGTSGKQVRDLYALHNGMCLYCQGDMPAVEFFPIAEWEAKNRQWKEWWEGALSDDELYDFQKEGVAFGEPSASGNYFVFYQGKVHYWDHDGGDDAPLAESFFEFLCRLVSDPAKLLHDLGCHARYSDGKTGIQWIPKKYRPDLQKLTPPASVPAKEGGTEESTSKEQDSVWSVHIVFAAGKEMELDVRLCSYGTVADRLRLGLAHLAFDDPQVMSQQPRIQSGVDWMPDDAPFSKASPQLAMIQEVRFLHRSGEIRRQAKEMGVIAQEPTIRKLTAFLLRTIRGATPYSKRPRGRSRHGER
jgi:hypothetical protein